MTILIIAGVVGVLQLMLFFKIWRMTDDVAQIYNKYCNSEETRQTSYLLVIKLKMLGRKTEAIDTLNQRTDDYLNHLVNQLQNTDINPQKLQQQWTKFIMEESRLYRYLGSELPEEYQHFDFNNFESQFHQIQNS